MFAERWSQAQDEEAKRPVGYNYFVGIDLGQSQDFTAIAICQRLGTAYHVRRLERMRGEPYPQIVTRIRSIMKQLPGAVLVADKTGVGAPVIDMLVAAGLDPRAITITGGDKPSHGGYGALGQAPRDWRVPKRDLVSVLLVLLQSHRLKVAKGPLSDILAAEMLNFRIKIDAVTAHDSYSAWRESEHDDLVLSVALACWFAEYKPQPSLASEYALRSVTLGSTY